MACKIALIGDVHSFWTSFDTDYFNDSDYDMLLFTGDLPKITGSVPDALKLAKLTKPGIVIPGNHDAATVVQFLAELKNYPLLCKLTSLGQSRRVQKIATTLGHLQLGGFSIHPLPQIDADLACIVARPHSMGGDRLYFQSYLKKQFAITSLKDSQKRLCELVDASPEKLIFLAHNGPSGLGCNATDPWGCDFDPSLGDFGDSDLRFAIEYAKNKDKKILAVVAGHMHHHVKGDSAQLKKGRNWQVCKDNVLYINAARVPRIFKRDNKVWHHHIALHISDTVTCEEVLLSP